MKKASLLFISFALLGACGGDGGEQGERDGAAGAAGDAGADVAAVDSRGGGSGGSGGGTGGSAGSAGGAAGSAGGAGGTAGAGGMAGRAGGAAGGVGGAAGGAAGGMGGAAGGMGGAAGGMGGAAGGTGGTAGASGMMTSAVVTASTGGTLTLGGVSLKVPAGALDADKTITLVQRAATTDEAARGDIKSAIYDFGPDGTKFKVPVDLTLPIDGAVPADKDAVVAWLDGKTGLWVRTPSVASGGKVTGSVTHFTSFAVVFVGKNGKCPGVSACGGGIPQGTWDITSACLTEQAPRELQKCGENGGTIMARSTLDISGSVTITGDRFTSMQTLHSNVYATFDAACMAALQASTTPWKSCGDVQTQLNKSVKAGQPTWTCAGTVAEGCNCLTSASQVLDGKGTITASGNQITFVREGSTSPAVPNDYCLKGDVLTVSSADAVYTAVKRK